MSKTTTDPESLRLVNEHREALGREPMAEATPRDLLLVEACASYGEDRWREGVLEEVLASMPDGELLGILEEGDPRAEHDDLSEPEGAFAGAWREAGRRGLLERRRPRAAVPRRSRLSPSTGGRR